MILNEIKHYKGETYCLIFDDGNTYYLHAEQLVSSKLRKGSDISKHDFAAIWHESENRRACETAISCLSHKDYPSVKLFEKLCASYDERSCAYAVDRMEKLGLIDDEKYARRKAADLINNKKYGIYRVRMVLRNDSISEETLDKVLEEFDSVDTDEIVCSLILKKYKAAVNDPEYKKKIFAALQRRGFSFDEINSGYSLAREAYNEGVSSNEY